jgi:Flp pilus assembly protein TadD
MHCHFRLRLLGGIAVVALLAGCAMTPRDGGEPSLTAQTKLKVAQAAESSGNQDMAANVYASAAQEAPNNDSVQLSAAEGLARNGKFSDAAGLLTARLQAEPNNADLLRALGGVQILEGQPEAAVGTLGRVLAAHPDDLKALANKGVALDTMGNHAEAQALYHQALGLRPNDPAISNDLALSLMQSGHLAQARRTLEPFRNVAGLPERIGINLGLLDAASGQAELARSALSHVKSDDLVALTQAIQQEGGSGQTGLR